MKATSALKKIESENMNAADVCDKLSLDDIHGQIGMLSYEFYKAMSPIRAIIALEDSLMNAEGTEGGMAREDALNLASVALMALTKTNTDLYDLASRIENQDLAECRKRAGMNDNKQCASTKGA